MIKLLVIPENRDIILGWKGFWLVLNIREDLIIFKLIVHYISIYR